MKGGQLVYNAVVTAWPIRCLQLPKHRQKPIRFFTGFCDHTPGIYFGQSALLVGGSFFSSHLLLQTGNGESMTRYPGPLVCPIHWKEIYQPHYRKVIINNTFTSLGSSLLFVNCFRKGHFKPLTASLCNMLGRGSYSTNVMLARSFPLFILSLQLANYFL